MPPVVNLLAPDTVPVLNTLPRRPQRAERASIAVASKASGSPYSPADVVSAASVASVLRLIEFGKPCGRTLTAIGTTQSMRNDAALELLAVSGSTASGSRRLIA